jgi:N-acetylglucosaminyldiphosphoundecaprenol N-acetyl-beta-D-mannosaminyltransferase
MAAFDTQEPQPASPAVHSPSPCAFLRPQRPPIAILGVPFDNVTTTEAVAAIEEMIDSGQPHYLVTANVDFLVQARSDVELRRILLEAHLVLCDGTPLLWASRLLGNPLPERVAGADLVPELIRVAAEKKYRLFFLGATPDSAAQAVARLRAEQPGVIIAGHYSPPFETLLEMDHDEIKRRILAARPDLLFVAFGCPKAEKWIAMNYRGLGVPVAAGVGATIDFLAGRVKRAPLWMQRTGTEWIFRLAQEPRRLFGRYARDLWVFGWSILAQGWRLRWSRRRPSFVEAAPPHGPRPAAEQSSMEDSLACPCRVVHLPERLDLAAVSNDPLLADPAPIVEQPWFLDLADVKFIDSTGVGLLIRWEKRMRSRGCQMVLLAPSPAVRRTLELMRLEDFFASAPDLASARQLVENRARQQPVEMLESGAATDLLPLRWHGEITAANAELVWETSLPLLAAVVGRLVLDLTHVRFIDSSGLGLLLRAKKLAQRRGVTLTLMGVQPAVRNVLRHSRLEEFLLSGARSNNTAGKKG